MATWHDLASAKPDLAAAGRRLIYRDTAGEALLATLLGNGLPRIHPVNVEIVDGRLYVFVIGHSPKRRDLEMDGRYALHAHIDPAAPSEFSVRGRARLVSGALRETIASSWSYSVDDSHVLFELTLESALHGLRPTPDAWPPRYSSWRADSAR